MSAVRTEGLTKRYPRSDRNALQGLDLEVREGEFFGFLGPNGAGKTTTINLLLDFIRPSAGTAFVFDRPAADPAVRRRLGYLPESVNLHAYYRGAALLDFYGALHGMPADARRTRADALLERLGLASARDQLVATYSKGMQQRLGMAQALLHDPELLILDEPTASLDPLARRDFRDLLAECKRRGKTVFLSSHILSEVETICDRVAILKDGRLLRVGKLDELAPPTATRLVVRSVGPETLAALAQIGVRLSVDARETTIVCPAGSARDRVERLLAGAGVAVERVEAETPSLEDVFLSAVA